MRKRETALIRRLISHVDEIHGAQIEPPSGSWFHSTNQVEQWLLDFMDEH